MGSGCILLVVFGLSDCDLVDLQDWLAAAECEVEVIPAEEKGQ